MQVVSLGHTGLKVSRLCFGTMGVGSSAWKPWVLSRNDICCPIIGASTASQVENNVGALDLELTAEEIAGLDALYRPRDVINDYVPKPMPRYWRGESHG